MVTVHDLEGAVDNNLPLKYTPFFILEEQKIYTSFSTSSLIFTVRVVRHWDRLPWAVVTVPRFRKCLYSALRHRVWIFLGGLVWSQELDLIIVGQTQDILFFYAMLCYSSSFNLLLLSCCQLSLLD